MNDAEKLRGGRDLLLKLHKSLVDYERATYETFNGPMSPGAFLNVLLNDEDFEWLRRFSTLIVDIDEMFAQKDGFSEEAVFTHLERMRNLTAMEGEDDYFKAKYQIVLQNDLDAASLHAELKQMIKPVI
jgi:hypothetical protein